MKKLLFAALLLLAFPNVYAQDGKHNLAIAAEVSKYAYQEPELPIRDDGTFYGVSMVYTGRSLLTSGSDVSKEDPSFGQLELRYMQGDTDYTGSTWGGTPVKSYGSPDYYVEGALKIGAVYEISPAFELWPYMGLGARYLVNNGQKVFPSAYRRTSTYAYLPLGLNAKFNFNGGFHLILNGQFDWLLSGTQRSHLSDAGGTLGDVTNNQQEGWGARASVKLEKDIKKTGLFIEPFLRYWRIQESNMAYAEIKGSGGWYVGVVEPYNTTMEYGLKIGAAF